jgi:hypothetical protein
MHAYIHTYVHTYIHACTHTYMHTYIHAYILCCDISMENDLSPYKASLLRCYAQVLQGR